MFYEVIFTRFGMKMQISRHLLSVQDIIMPIYQMVSGLQADLVSSLLLEEMVGWMFGITSTDRMKSLLVIKYLMLLLLASRLTLLEVTRLCS